MSEHLSSDQRDKIEGTIQIACAYICEYATDGDLFALQAILSNQACQLAQRLRQMGDGMLGPDRPHPPMGQPQESLNHRLMAAEQAMQRMG